MKDNYDFENAAVIKGPVKSKDQVDKAITDQQKVLTSIRLDKDLVDFAKKEASREGIGYLTWLNRELRKSLLGKESLESRLERLEKAVFEKKGA